MSIYNPGNLLDKEPVAISGAIKATLAVLVAGGAISWSATTIASVIVALELWLSLLVRSKSTPTANFEALATLRPRVLRAPK